MDESTSEQCKISYSYNNWLRLRTLCVAMRQTEQKVQKLKEEIETKLKATLKIREKRAEIQACQIAVAAAETQLDARRAKVRTLSAKLGQLRRQFGAREAQLSQFKQKNDESAEKWTELQRDYIATREKIIWTSAQLLLRRKQLVQDIAFVFNIDLNQSNRSNCTCNQIAKLVNVHLPDAEDYYGHNELDLSVALGYVCHLICILSRIFDIPLRYPVVFRNSRSLITSHAETTDLGAKSNEIRKFPLFTKGQDKASFQYAVFLMNKNIAQFRFECGLPTNDLRATLSNLASLIGYLTAAKIESHVWRPLTTMNGGDTSSFTSLACSTNSLSNPESDKHNGALLLAGARERLLSYYSLSESYSVTGSFDNASESRDALSSTIIDDSQDHVTPTAADQLRATVICKQRPSILANDFMRSSTANKVVKEFHEGDDLDASYANEVVETWSQTKSSKEFFVENCKKLLKTCYLSAEDLNVAENGVNTSTNHTSEAAGSPPPMVSKEEDENLNMKFAYSGDNANNNNGHVILNNTILNGSI